MTDEQRQRIAELLGELESALNAADIHGMVSIEVGAIDVRSVRAPDPRSIYNLEMRVRRSEVIPAKRRGAA